MNGDLGKQYLKNYITNTDTSIVEYMRKKVAESETIGKIPSEIISAFTETLRKGKRIRGALIQLGYELSGGQPAAGLIDATLSIEFFHAAVLVHDDIMDRDMIRRGLPTLHLQYKSMGERDGVKPQDALHYGNSQAINLGDIGFYMSWEMLLNADLPAENKLKAGQIYADYVIRVAEGQILDVANLTTVTATEDTIMKVLEYKTAEYTGVLPLLMGAALAGKQTDELRKDIHEYGINFGWAFQIQDDILGIFGEEEEFGKPIGSDLREGKNTLLTHFILTKGTEEQKKFQKYVLGNPSITRDDVEKMKQVFTESGALEYVKQKGWEYVEKAKQAIPRITTDEKSAKVLASLVDYMMERTV